MAALLQKPPTVQIERACTMEDDDFWIDVLRVDSVLDSASSRLFFQGRDRATFSITMDTWHGCPYMRALETLEMTANVDAARKMRDWLNEFLAIADGCKGSGEEEGEVGGGGNK